MVTFKLASVALSATLCVLISIRMLHDSLHVKLKFITVASKPWLREDSNQIFPQAKFFQITVLNEVSFINKPNYYKMKIAINSNESMMIYHSW